MLFNIFNVLEKIGLSAQKRAVHVQFSNELLNSQVFLQRIEGQHQLNGGLEAELICLSTSAQIALKQFIGVQVAVDQVTDSGQLFRTTGIVTEASYGQSDGALTLYKLTLKDATNLWHKRRNSRVFMNKSIIEVTEVLFKEWQEKSQLFATSLSLDLSGLSQSYDIRPFIMQHNESDYDFLTGKEANNENYKCLSDFNNSKIKDLRISYLDFDSLEGNLIKPFNYKDGVIKELEVGGCYCSESTIKILKNKIYIYQACDQKLNEPRIYNIVGKKKDEFSVEYQIDTNNNKVPEFNLVFVTNGKNVWNIVPKVFRKEDLLNLNFKIGYTTDTNLKNKKIDCNDYEE